MRNGYRTDLQNHVIVYVTATTKLSLVALPARSLRSIYLNFKTRLGLYSGSLTMLIETAENTVDNHNDHCCPTYPRNDYCPYNRAPNDHYCPPYPRNDYCPHYPRNDYCPHNRAPNDHYCPRYPNDDCCPTTEPPTTTTVPATPTTTAAPTTEPPTTTTVPPTPVTTTLTTIEQPTTTDILTTTTQPAGPRFDILFLIDVSKQAKGRLE
ncbi:hypothetical protein OSTOST_16409, partial [Ostertagia ostertagi]